MTAISLEKIGWCFSVTTPFENHALEIISTLYLREISGDSPEHVSKTPSVKSGKHST